MGNGVGDINIKAECMSLIQTYSIHDYWLYAPTFPSYTYESVGSGYGKLILNNPINLPATFEISFTCTLKGSRNYMTTILIGESSSNFYYQGIDSVGLLNCISRNNSRAVLNRNNVSKSPNTEYSLRIMYDGTDLKLYNGESEVISTNNSEYTKSKFVGALVGEQYEIKNIIIKAL